MIHHINGKCENNDCCSRLRSIVQTVSQGKFLSTPLVVEKVATLKNPENKNEKDKFAIFYECLVLKHIWLRSYLQVKKCL